VMKQSQAQGGHPYDVSSGAGNTTGPVSVADLWSQHGNRLTGRCSKNSVWSLGEGGVRASPELRKDIPRLCVLSELSATEGVHHASQF